MFFLDFDLLNLDGCFWFGCSAAEKCSDTFCDRGRNCRILPDRAHYELAGFFHSIDDAFADINELAANGYAGLLDDSLNVDHLPACEFACFCEVARDGLEVVCNGLQRCHEFLSLIDEALDF